MNLHHVPTLLDSTTIPTSSPLVPSFWSLSVCRTENNKFLVLYWGMACTLVIKLLTKSLMKNTSSHILGFTHKQYDISRYHNSAAQKHAQEGKGFESIKWLVWFVCTCWVSTGMLVRRDFSGTESTVQNFGSLARFSTTFQMCNHHAYQIEWNVMAMYISKQMNALFSLKQFSLVFFLQHKRSSETLRTWEINESKLVSGRI